MKSGDSGNLFPARQGNLLTQRIFHDIRLVQLFHQRAEGFVVGTRLLAPQQTAGTAAAELRQVPRQENLPDGVLVRQRLRQHPRRVICCSPVILSVDHRDDQAPALPSGAKRPSANSFASLCHFFPGRARVLFPPGAGKIFPDFVKPFPAFRRLFPIGRIAEHASSAPLRFKAEPPTRAASAALSAAKAVLRPLIAPRQSAEQNSVK